ncbi:MAG: hypothetical protein ABMA14_16380, partial [Hyphomonadaceae bacterium]
LSPSVCMRDAEQQIGVALRGRGLRLAVGAQAPLHAAEKFQLADDAMALHPAFASRIGMFNLKRDSTLRRSAQSIACAAVILADHAARHELG